MTSFLVILAVLAWLTLPLVPALREWLRPTDASPLVLERGNTASISERFVTAREVLAQLGAEGLAESEARSLATERFGVEVVGSARYEAGSAPASILATGRLVLKGEQPRLAQVDADELVLDATFASQALMTAHSRARVASGARFALIQAPVIEVGRERRHSHVAHIGPTAEGAPGLRAQAVDGGTWQAEQGWWFVPGEARIDDGLVVAGDIVARGGIHIAPGARLQGSLRSEGRVDIEAGARIDGNVFGREVFIAEGASIVGSVVAEQRIVLADDVAVGDAQHPASVSADEVSLGAGVVVHGAIQAHAGCITRDG